MQKLNPKINKPNGFTLVEIIVVAGLIIFMTSMILRNFVGSRLDLERTANVVASDIRLAQQLAISSRQFQGTCMNPDGTPVGGNCVPDPEPRNRCGYGITLDPNHYCNGYIIYTGKATVDASENPQSCGNYRFQSRQDTPAYAAFLLDPRLNFDDPGGSGNCNGNVAGNRFRDTFFYPPGPTTAFGGNSVPIAPADYYNQIVIKKVGKKLTGNPSGRCSVNGPDPDCIYICVYLSGRVEVTRQPTCPAAY